MNKNKWLRPWNKYAMTSCSKEAISSQDLALFLDEFEKHLSNFELTQDDKEFYFRLTSSPNLIARKFIYEKTVLENKKSGYNISLGLKISPKKPLYDRCDIFVEEDVVKLIINPYELYLYNEFTMLQWHLS